MCGQKAYILGDGANAGLNEIENSWPGYKMDLTKLSKERCVGTLKVDEDTFMWRHKTCGERLLCRRISIDDDKGPFEDESEVFYIL